MMQYFCSLYQEEILINLAQAQCYTARF